MVVNQEKNTLSPVFESTTFQALLRYMFQTQVRETIGRGASIPCAYFDPCFSNMQTSHSVVILPRPATAAVQLKMPLQLKRNDVYCFDVSAF